MNTKISVNLQIKAMGRYIFSRSSGSPLFNEHFSSNDASKTITDAQKNA
jgi:hypothetical protein